MGHVVITVSVQYAGVEKELADEAYLTTKTHLPQSGNHLKRGCATNSQRDCNCQGQGQSEDTKGVSFSFGCSWSTYTQGWLIDTDHARRCAFNVLTLKRLQLTSTMCGLRRWNTQLFVHDRIYNSVADYKSSRVGVVCRMSPLFSFCPRRKFFKGGCRLSCRMSDVGCPQI